MTTHFKNSSIKVDGVTVSSQGGELNTAELKRDNLYLGNFPVNIN